MPAEKISVEKAKTNKLFYFVANVVVYRESDGRCLILKRHPREIVHPGKYGVIGGKLDWSDLDIAHPLRLNGDVLDYPEAVERLLAREVKEEAGIEIGKELIYINSVAFVRPDEVPVVLVKFGAKYKGGDVKLEEGAFTEYAWVSAAEAKQYPCMEGITEEIAATVEAFSLGKSGDLQTGVYEHFKGNRYKVFGVARHSETEEKLVVYQKLYDDHSLCVRPLQMFVEEIERDGRRMARFRYIEK